MQTKETVGVLFCLLCWLSQGDSAPAFGQTSPLAPALLFKEANAKWALYRSAYLPKLQGNVSGRKSDGTEAFRFDFKNRSDSSLYSADWVRSGSRHREASAVNRQYTFAVTQKDERGWLLDQLSLDPSKIVAPMMGLPVRDIVFRWAARQFMVSKEPLPELVNHPSFLIRSVKNVTTAQGLAAMRVEFGFTPYYDQKAMLYVPLESGTVTLVPSEFWRVLECDVTEKYIDGIKPLKSSCEVELRDGGVPIFKSLRVRTRSPKESSEAEYLWESDLRFEEEPHESDFYLTAFELPEPMGVRLEKARSHYYLAFVAIGIGGLALGMYFWRRFKRLKGADQAGRKIVPPRPGFTLIELLVVIAIICVLIALIVPAVQKVRGAALRAECLNNLKQIGLAAHQYHDTARVFPSGMRGPEAMRFSSWLAALLPYIEQGALWRTTQDAYQQSPSPFQNPPHHGLATPIHAYSCPADGRAEQAAFAPIDKFPVAFTNYLGVSGKDLTTLDGILFRDSRIRMGDITDGTSQTLLAGERPPSANLQFGWWYAGVGQKFTGSADVVLGVEEQNVLPIVKGGCPAGTYQFAPGNISDQCDMFHFWSPHPGGAHFLFADGSVRFLRYEAALIMPALASRAGNDVVNGDF